MITTTLPSFTVGQSLCVIALLIIAVVVMLYQAKSASDRELEIYALHEDDARFVEYVEKLRAKEGDTVEIFCTDREPRSTDTQCAITCSGDWTGFVFTRFTGETILDALEKASVARSIKERHDVSAAQ